MTSWNYFKRQCTSFNLRQPTLWCEKLPLGTAEHWPGAARLKICVRTLLFLLLYFSACRGWPLRDNERTPVLPLFFCASKLIHEEGLYASPRFCTYLNWPFLLRIFSEKTCNNVGNYTGNFFHGKMFEVSERIRAGNFAEMNGHIFSVEISRKLLH